jgi:hypothetical protein
MIVYKLPFLMELKTVLDWVFTKTSLDVIQWLELTEINHAMYNNRNGNRVYFFVKPLGEQIFAFEKGLCGTICLGLMLFFLVMPFLFFSNLSVMSKTNLVYDGNIDFQINIEDKTNN